MRSPVDHRRGVVGMVIVTLLWSTAGVVSRQLESASTFEVTFWRSLFTALTLAVVCGWRDGRRVPALLWQGGPVLWLSGVLWSVMFTCFMVAITLTTVANVLVTMSVSPLVTALLAHFMLRQRVSGGTWVAIVVAGAGIAWMVGRGVSAHPEDLLGTLVALAVPVVAAMNWNLIRRSGAQLDLVPALLIGAVLSALVTAPLAWPFSASAHDVGLLAGLGIFQLALPCILAVGVAKLLSAPEVALLSLLEIIFGIALAWLWADERPSADVLWGGSVVLTTLVVNEGWALWRSRRVRSNPVIAGD
ncbi:MAG: DMT family transporter [Pseudomonadota bacterium]